MKYLIDTNILIYYFNGSLARLSKLDLSMEQEILLDEVNDFNLEVRYPQYKSEFYKRCTRKFSADYYQKINEMMIWLNSGDTLLNCCVTS